MKVRPQLRKEHVHFKPESYIGSYEELHERMWIVENNRVVLKTVAFVPAMLKLCEELIVNAVQHGRRDPSSHIQLTVSENGTIAVTNEGMISFGELAQNPTPAQLQAVFGEEEIGSQLYRRGRGAKLVNMFSTNFFVQVGNQQAGTAHKVVWRDCLTFSEPPRTMPYNQHDYTKVRAVFDLARFRMTKFSQDFIGLLERRVWDIAAMHRVKVIFNGRMRQFDGLEQYAALFMREQAVQMVEGGGWRVAVGPSDHGYQQISYINGCYWTRNGGTHVSSVVAQIASKALQRLHKRLKDPAEVMQSPGRFTSNYIIFVDLTIEHPQFNSVTRDTLLTSKMPSSFRITESVLDFLDKQQALKAYRQMARQREKQKLGESIKAGQTLALPRLQDAGKSGTSSRCTLLIVENQATRQLMAVGLECVDRDFFGIYTLKGKPPNAREHKHSSQHPDFAAITKALGLTPKAQNVQQLRYGSVLIVADQDHEGVSIKGLLLNFFESTFPWVLRTRGFVKLLIPPVVRVANSIGNIKQFLSDKDYRSWSTLNSVNEWTPTHFGTIGHMDPLYMRDIFADRKKYSFAVTYQTTLDDSALSLPYGPDVDARRKWLEEHRPEAVLDYNINSKTVPLREFVDKQLAHVFYKEATRGLPCIIDGLTNAQRKALFYLSREGQEIQLDRLVGLIQQEGANEEAELRKGLISLAQNYVGSNNLPILQGKGQFGTRAGGGKDFAPSRHLRVALPSHFRLLFATQDDELLTYFDQHPTYYVPILPLLLINGFSQGPSLWKSNIFPRKVGDVIQAIKDRLTKGALRFALTPGWEGFKGAVTTQKNGFLAQGLFQLRCTRTVLVREIPPLQTLREYKAGLEQREEIEQVKEQQRGDSSLLVVRFAERRVPRDIAQYLQLNVTIQEASAVLLNPSGKPKRYQSAADVLDEYFQVRLKLYEQRKVAGIARLQRRIELFSEKIRFIRDVLGGEFQLTDSQEAWRIKFVRKGYKRYQDLTRAPSRTPDPCRDFEHLEKLPFNQFSERRVEQLRAERTDCEEKLLQLRRTNEREMWLADLAQFEDNWRKSMRHREQMLLDSLKRAQNFRKYPSEPSPSRNNNQPAIEFEDLSLDSQACAQLEASKTQGMSQEVQVNTPVPKVNGKRKQTKELKDSYSRELKEGKIDETPGKVQSQQDLLKAEQLADRRRFQVQIREMERKNIEFQDKMRKEADAAKREAERVRKQEVAEKNRNRDERLKREEQRAREARQKQLKVKDKPSLQREANLRRQILGRQAAELGKKIQQEQRQKRECRDKSQKSNREHLPASNGITPRITVPFQCDPSTFQVTHVERKRFSVKESNMGQAEINRIHADIIRAQEEKDQRANRKNTCIEID